jgi:aminoglycoside phosphotransferase (APT) family kinase protein
MSEVEYSKRLGRLSDAQLQAALDRFDLGMLTIAEPIPFGLFGQNLFVTSTRGAFVLRGCPHYAWQFPTEEFFADLLHERTEVPVPHPYLYEPSTEVFGWSYCIMPRLPGVQLADEQQANRLPIEDRHAIAQALARTLVEAQTVTWDFCGKFDVQRGTIEPMQHPYRAWVMDQIREHLTRAQGYNNNTPASDIEWAENIISTAQNALAAPFQPCIVFEDFKEPNTVVERTADGWRVSGLFDLMTTHFGDGEADLARQVGTYLRTNPPLADEFVSEYLNAKTVESGFAARQQFYMLYDSVLIWTFWQGYAGGFPEDKTLTLEKWATPFVSYWDKYK